MKTQDPHSDLHDGFEVAPLPPIGPDGAPQIPPQRSDPPARPSLCRAGPCRHYHRLVTQVEAENPRAVRLPIVFPQGTPGAEETPQGTLYRAPPVFHVEAHHYCYPDTGIEMNLGALPIVECNLWDPIDPDDHQSNETERRRYRFRTTLKGQAYETSVAFWEAARAAEQSEAAEADRLIAQSMTEAPTIACQVCGKAFGEHELDIETRCAGCRGANLLPRQPRATHPNDTENTP